MIVELNGIDIEIPDFKPSPFCQNNCQSIEQTQIEIIIQREPRKAVAFRRIGKITLDGDFIESIAEAGRFAVVGHEVGHLLGADCQRCADFYAGRFLSSRGFEPEESMREIKRCISRINYSDFQNGIENGR